MAENDKILRLPQVIERTGLTRSTIYAMIDAKVFPPQFRLGQRSVGWFESDISKWLAERKRAKLQPAR